MLLIGFAGEAPVLFFFGFFLFSMSLQDLIKMKRKKFVKNAWLFDHISRMSGSFIATTTAFIVVNFSMTPAWVLWLLPTAIGTPLIFRVSAKWERNLINSEQRNELSLIILKSLLKNLIQSFVHLFDKSNRLT